MDPVKPKFQDFFFNFGPNFWWFFKVLFAHSTWSLWKIINNKPNKNEETNFFLTEIRIFFFGFWKLISRKKILSRNENCLSARASNFHFQIPRIFSVKSISRNFFLKFVKSLSWSTWWHIGRSDWSSGNWFHGKNHI